MRECESSLPPRAKVEHRLQMFDDSYDVVLAKYQALKSLSA